MEFTKHFPLKQFNTFGIQAYADEFVSVGSESELKMALEHGENGRIFLLGGGSNMLLTGDLHALVIHVNLKGKRIVHEDEDYVLIEAMAGENWHEFVLWTISQNFGGLENMSLIPGNIGTAPIQNIGAYGTELKDHFVSCRAMAIADGSIREFTKDECNFGYRESIFKQSEKDKYVIASVIFRLSKHNHRINTGYGDIQKELEKAGISTPTIKDVSDAVIAIRRSKLPDPKELGNSGSFFKNPVVPIETYQKALENHPEMPHYKVSETEVKVPAGWLIEQAGFKGKRFGDAGVHKNQALVLVNYGDATGQELIDLARLIQKTVAEKFGIAIEAEVNIVGS